MKKLLVPCDFSKPALHAFEFALDMAAKSANSTVHLLHVIELPVMSDSVLMPVLNFEEQHLEDARVQAEKEFANLKKQYNKDSIKIESEVWFGRPAEQIQQYTKDHAIDMIVMGSHGAKGMKEFFVGSNAEKIVRHAQVPVLVLKDRYKGPIKSIVFPNTLDTENQETLVQKVKALQHFLKAHLHIVWVNTPVNFTTDTVTHKRLNEFVKRFQFKDYSLHVFNHLNPEEGILEFSNSVNASLIAMGTHGRKGLAHVMYGSLTESLVNHSDKLIWSYVISTDSTNT